MKTVFGFASKCESIEIVNVETGKSRAVTLQGLEPVSIGVIIGVGALVGWAVGDAIMASHFRRMRNHDVCILPKEGPAVRGKCTDTTIAPWGWTAKIEGVEKPVRLKGAKLVMLRHENWGQRVLTLLMSDKEALKGLLFELGREEREAAAAQEKTLRAANEEALALAERLQGQRDRYSEELTTLTERLYAVKADVIDANIRTAKAVRDGVEAVAKAQAAQAQAQAQAPAAQAQAPAAQAQAPAAQAQAAEAQAKAQAAQAQAQAQAPAAQAQAPAAQAQAQAPAAQAQAQAPAAQAQAQAQAPAAQAQAPAAQAQAPAAQAKAQAAQAQAQAQAPAAQAQAPAAQAKAKAQAAEAQAKAQAARETRVQAEATYVLRVQDLQSAPTTSPALQSALAPHGVLALCLEGIHLTGQPTDEAGCLLLDASNKQKGDLLHRLAGQAVPAEIAQEWNAMLAATRAAQEARATKAATARARFAG